MDANVWLEGPRWRRCNGKSPQREINERVSRESGKVGNRGRLVRVGSIEASILTKIDIRALEAGFKDWQSGRDWQRPQSLNSNWQKVKMQLSLTRMERDILNNAVAYVAKESLHGTR